MPIPTSKSSKTMTADHAFKTVSLARLTWLKNGWFGPNHRVLVKDPTKLTRADSVLYTYAIPS